MFSFSTATKAAVAVVAAVALPLIGGSAAFAGDAGFPPTAVTDNYSTMQDTQLVVDAASGLLANDSSGGQSGLIVNSVSVSPNGVLDFLSDGSFAFTPTAGFVGTAYFTYSDFAGGMGSNVADIFIVVTAAPLPLPVANADFYTTPQDTPLVVDIASGLLANDTDVWQMFFVDNTSGASVAMLADGDFTFTPVAGFVGTVTFKYQAKDSNFQVSNWADVTIEVTPAVISVIPSNPIPHDPGNPGDGSGTDGDLPTLAYTGTDDLTTWLFAPAAALLALGGTAVWFARRRSALEN